MSGGSSGRMRSISALQAMRDVDLVRADERPDREVHRLALGEPADDLGLLGSELHARHVRQAHDRVAPVGDDELLELADRAEIGVGEQVDLHDVALGLADGREIVVALQRGLHVAGREVQSGQAIRVDPDPHRELASALEADALHAWERRELRLQRANEPIGDLGQAALGRGEAHVERRVRPVRALHVDDGRLSFRRQLGAHLLEACRHLGERGGAVVVELQTDRHRAHAGAARRFDVSMPPIADTTRSIGVVRKPRTVSALAPEYTVVMMTDELSIFGYCCTGSVDSARQPTSTITRLTTTASTGWRMKTSRERAHR